MSIASTNTPTTSIQAPSRPPAASVWYRMSWKELRQDLPLLGIFVGGLLMTLAIVTLSGRSLHLTSSDLANFWFVTIYFFIPVFSLAVGIFIFAPEKENRTSQFLGILPISSGQVVSTKIAIGLLTIVAFICLGVLLQFFGPMFIGEKSAMLTAEGLAESQNSLSVSSLARQWQWQMTPVVSCLILTLECFFWGAICSLIFKRAIFAAVLAGACFALVSWGMPAAISAACAERSSYGPPSQRLFSSSFFTIFLVSKAATYAAMGLALVRLGSRWLGYSPNIDKQTWLGHTSDRSVDRADSLAGTSPTVIADRAPVPSRVYSALVWQSFRQFRTTFSFTLLGATPILLGMFLIAATINEFKFDPPFILLCLLVALIAIPLIASMFVFQIDHQDRNYRFFQEHREYGRKLWLARLLPAALLSFFCGVILLVGIVVISWKFWNAEPGLILMQLGTALIASFGVFCAFAVGQFNSMFLRSGVFIVVSVLAMTILLSACLGWLFFLDARLVAFLLPIPLGLLAITWWRAPHWLAERNRIANAVVPWSTLGAVFVGSLTAFAVFRFASVPESRFSLDEAKANYAALGDSQSLRNASGDATFERAILLRDAARETVDVDSIGEAYDLRLFGWPTPDYARSFDSKNQSPLRQFVEQNHKSLKLLASADEQPESSQPVFDPWSNARRVELVSKISLLLSAQATVAEWDGNLELALKYWLQLRRFNDQYDVESTNAMLGLFRWSELAGQSPELIKRAINAIAITPDQWQQQTEYLTQSRKLDFVNWYEGMVTNQSLTERPLGIRFNFPIKFPWELERSKRWTLIEIDELNLLRSQRAGLFRTDTSLSPILNLGASLNEIYAEATASVYYPNHRAGKELFSIDQSGRWGDFIAMLRYVQTYRYVRVRMALNAWKLEHDVYPVELAQLVPDYFESLPLDVLYGIDFAYSPDGLDAKVCVNGNGGSIRRDRQNHTLEVSTWVYECMLEPGQPFLLRWSLPRAPTRWTCTVMDEPGIQPFECYDYSGPDYFSDYFARYSEAWDYVLPAIGATDRNKTSQ